MFILINDEKVSYSTKDRKILSEELHIETAVNIFGTSNLNSSLIRVFDKYAYESFINGRYRNASIKYYNSEGKLSFTGRVTADEYEDRTVTLTIRKDIDLRLDNPFTYIKNRYNPVQAIAELLSEYQASGAALISSGSKVVSGTGTLFLTELSPGQTITINNETRTIESITSELSLTVTQAFGATSSGIPIYAQLGGGTIDENSYSLVRALFESPKLRVNFWYNSGLDQKPIKEAISEICAVFHVYVYYENGIFFFLDLLSYDSIIEIKPDKRWAVRVSNQAPDYTVCEVKWDFEAMLNFNGDIAGYGHNLKAFQMSRQDALTMAYEGYTCSGTVSASAGSNLISGSGTLFLTELEQGQMIQINGLSRTITSVNSNAQIAVDTVINNALTGQYLTARPNLYVDRTFQRHTGFYCYNQRRISFNSRDDLNLNNAYVIIKGGVKMTFRIIRKTLFSNYYEYQGILI